MHIARGERECNTESAPLPRQAKTGGVVGVLVFFSSYFIYASFAGGCPVLPIRNFQGGLACGARFVNR